MTVITAAATIGGVLNTGMDPHLRLARWPEWRPREMNYLATAFEAVIHCLPERNAIIGAKRLRPPVDIEVIFEHQDFARAELVGEMYQTGIREIDFAIAITSPEFRLLRSEVGTG